MKRLFSLWIIVFLMLRIPVPAQNLSGVRIYINPGHGGYDSDDRNVPVALFAAGDTAGFWESKSNLIKGLYLEKLLQSAGAKVFMSRTLNRTEDDRTLSAIAEEANANQVDFMVSIHSNAFNSQSNYPLELFHGWDNNPILPQSLAVANLFWDNLIANQATNWTYTRRNVRGDKSFAPASWNGYGVLRPLTVPGLISEGSFHDYIPETYRLLNFDFNHLEAWHLFRAFCTFYGGNPGNKGIIAGTVKDYSLEVSGYFWISGSNDQWMPVNLTRVTLNPGGQVYQVDGLNNGFFLFENLSPGTYQLSFEADKYQKQVIENIKVDSAAVSWVLCSLKQEPTVAGVVSLKKNDSEKINLYPNPARDFITVEIHLGNGTYPCQIAGMSGKTVRQGTLTMGEGKGILPVSGLNPGAYLLTIRSGIKNFRGLFLVR